MLIVLFTDSDGGDDDDNDDDEDDDDEDDDDDDENVGGLIELEGGICTIRFHLQSLIRIPQEGEHRKTT